MTTLEYLLTQLASEAAEVTHRATKALQFGITETQPGHDENNTARLMGEIEDFLGVLKILQDCFGFPHPDNNKIRAKRGRVEHYMEYARTAGNLCESGLPREMPALATLPADDRADLVETHALITKAIAEGNDEDEQAALRAYIEIRLQLPGRIIPMLPEDTSPPRPPAKIGDADYQPEDGAYHWLFTSDKHTTIGRFEDGATPGWRVCGERFRIYARDLVAVGPEITYRDPGGNP